MERHAFVIGTEGVVRTLTAPERYGQRFALQVLVCDFDGHQQAQALSPNWNHENPA